MSDNGKINAGDFVRYKNGDAISKVTIAKDGRVAVDTPVMAAEPCLIEDADRTDNKDAFLFEMQALSGKYDASVHVGFDRSDEVYTATVAVGEDSVKYPYTCGIDADNIMEVELWTVKRTGFCKNFKYCRESTTPVSMTEDYIICL